MKSKLISLISIAALVFLVGCKNVGTILTPAIIEQGAYTAAHAAVNKYPAIIPEVRIATEVICAAGNSTNISPANITADIDKITTLSPTTVDIVNAALLGYNMAWSALGANDSINNIPVLKQDLQAVCNGLTKALPPVSGTKMAIVPPAEFPLVHYK